jgi:hypothetical protein
MDMGDRLLEFSNRVSKLIFDLRAADPLIDDEICEPLTSAACFASIYHSDVEMSATDREIYYFASEVLRFLRTTHFLLRKLGRTYGLMDDDAIISLLDESNKLIKIFQRKVSRLRKKVKG